jgi:serine/threonine protein kinase
MGYSHDQNFGRYEIVSELGRGAMGVVYKARDPQINRLVALKTISLRGQDPLEEQEYRQRFVVEAQAGGRLQHTGIVAIYDAGEEAETHNPFLVLEYVGGESLNRILAREQMLPLPRALALIEELADALDYAHAQGVIHRDIKPANILISEEGHAKIADFGIAKLNLAHFTLPGRVLGTPAYMAPEQLSGEPSDGRADLFSLGVILYAMVTGHSAFHGNSATTVCFKVVNREPLPATTFDLHLPHELDDLISRAMAKDPAERFQRGSEFASAVRALRQQISSPNAGSQGATTGRRSTAANPQARRPGSDAGSSAGMEEAGGLLKAILKEPSRNTLIMAGALVVMLIAVGVRPKGVDVAQNSATSFAAPAEAGRPTQIPAVQTSPAVPAAAAPAASNASALSKDATVKTSHVKHRAAAPIAVASSTLDLSIQHQFKEASFSLWVDDKMAFTRALHGGSQQHLVVFHGTYGNESETLQVPAGTHTLRVQAQSADRSVDLSRTISADFIGGNEKTLHVTFEKHNTEMRLSLQ